MGGYTREHVIEGGAAGEAAGVETPQGEGASEKATMGGGVLRVIAAGGVVIREAVPGEVIRGMGIGEVGIGEF